MELEYLHVSHPTDDQLAQIRRTLPCKHLILRDCSNVTESGLAEICRISQLESLYLLQPDVSGEGIAQLRKARQLRHLRIGGAGCTDSTVASIHLLSSVNELQLVGTSISSEGLRSVAKMPNLSWLFISGSPINDQKIDVISNMPALQCVDLCGVGLQDEQLRTLARLPSLKYLQIFNNPISDTGLEVVEQMEHLVWVDVRKTLASEAAKERLRKNCPQLVIDDHTEVRFAEPRIHWQP